MPGSRSSAQEVVDYGYGDTTDYGYGDSNTTDYGYGKPSTTDYGYGGNDATDYGYGETDYGYGDSYQPMEAPKASAGRRSSSNQGGARKHRTVRRNSCVIRNQGDDKLAVAEFLMGPPPMSDRDMKAAAQRSAKVTA